MSRSVNMVILLGNVGSDPELRATQTGARVAKISLATNRGWTDRAGNRQEKTEWHRLTVYGRTVEFVEQYVTKGDRLYVSGRLEYSQTDSPQGTKYWTDIIVTELVKVSGAGEAGADERDEAGVPF